MVASGAKQGFKEELRVARRACKLHGASRRVSDVTARSALKVCTHGREFGGFSGPRVHRGFPAAQDHDNDDDADHDDREQAIEGDDHGSLPSATFVKGYVREMARMLKLDEQVVVEGYMARLSQQS